jgi:hypothetical protein
VLKSPVGPGPSALAAPAGPVAPPEKVNQGRRHLWRLPERSKKDIHGQRIDNRDINQYYREFNP